MWYSFLCANFVVLHFVAERIKMVLCAVTMTQNISIKIYELICSFEPHCQKSKWDCLLAQRHKTSDHFG